jgi:hypothetical protein
MKRMNSGGDVQTPVPPKKGKTELMRVKSAYWWFSSWWHVEAVYMLA